MKAIYGLGMVLASALLLGSRHRDMDNLQDTDDVSYRPRAQKDEFGFVHRDTERLVPEIKSTDPLAKSHGHGTSKRARRRNRNK